MATLHILCGLPGSGKSTLAKKLESEHAALRLTPDEWMERIVGDGYSEDKRTVVETIQCEIAEQALRLGVNVILENGFWTRRERDELQARAKNCGADTKLYYLDVARDELLRRLNERNANLPPNTFHIDESRLDDAITHFEVPTPDEPNLIIIK
ncbi:MAG TPA: ATP-binding protein [Candidatus Paceibacterota bacterium]|nr:ATP-binding protein [Candidatus Paceibacterota bacterium]